MTGLLMSFARLPRPLVVAVGLALVALMAAVDYATGPLVSLNVFYLLPVMLVAWLARSTFCGFIVTVATFAIGPIEAWATGFTYLSPGEALWNGIMRLAVFIIILVLMARMRALMERLATQAMVDELTGLGNVRALRETLAGELARGRRFGHPLSLAFIDLDGLKLVNDRFGHAAGDRLLVTFAAVARSNSRAVDTVARVGGDEFVVLLPETSADAALLMVDRLREAFAKAAGRPSSSHTCSIGLASFEVMPADADAALGVADRLMYQVKARGGDDVEAAEIDSTEWLEQAASGAATVGAAGVPGRS